MKETLTASLTFLRAHRVSVAVCLCIAVLSTLTILIGSSTPVPATNPIANKYTSSKPERTYADLSQKDSALYYQAFAAAKKGEHARADELLMQVDNQILLGHVLAERYLHESYKTDADELALWLENFADHPQTARVAKLAGRKGVADASEYADIAPLLHGKGYTDHLGARALPGSWYQGLSAWRKGSYAVAAKTFRQTAENEKVNDWHKAASYFWAARAYSKLKDKANTANMLEAAAEYKVTLYGMLAGAAMGDSVAISAASPYISARLEEAPEYVRARALVAANQNELAESELRKLFMQVDQGQRPEILAMAGELGLANLQIRLSKMDGLHEDERMFASYPMPNMVISAATDADPALVLAIARQESAFKAEVKSPAGAKGMMQVMPITATHVIKHPQFASLESDVIAAYGQVDLMQPSTNVKVGASYVDMLAKKEFIGGNLVKTLAAYNAGPGNVAAWNKTAKNINDPLLYIESIPFAETRNYVVQVLAHYAIYEGLMGENDTVISSLKKGMFPQYKS